LKLKISTLIAIIIGVLLFIINFIIGFNIKPDGVKSEIISQVNAVNEINISDVHVEDSIYNGNTCTIVFSYTLDNQQRQGYIVLLRSISNNNYKQNGFYLYDITEASHDKAIIAYDYFISYLISYENDSLQLEKTFISPNIRNVGLVLAVYILCSLIILIHRKLIKKRI